VSYLLVQTFL